MLARSFDLFSQRDLFGAFKQRDFAHLREVHADRIVYTTLHFQFGSGFLTRSRWSLLRAHAIGCKLFTLLNFRFIKQFYTQFVQTHQQ